jgi:tRNA 2-thiouridine synthesizing protein D
MKGRYAALFYDLTDETFMRYFLFVQGSPYSTQACHSAYRFCQHLANETDHQIDGVFFYQDSVLIANRLTQIPRDEVNIQQQWQQLAQQHAFPLFVCIAAAVRRGIISESEKVRYEVNHGTLADDFQLEGLGSFTQLITTSDKTITFR